MARGNRGASGRGNAGNRGTRGRGNPGRRIKVIGAKPKKPGRPRKHPRRSITTAPPLPEDYVFPTPETHELENAEEVSDDVDEIAEIEKRERAEGRKEE